MAIFISWSGTRSKAAAEALRDWLPDMFQSVEVWLSSEDISPGARWNNDLQEKLQESNFGIICVTQQNLNAPWILYEVGCLSKSIKNAFVCPLLIDLGVSDLLNSPLNQFQAISLKQDDFLKLVLAINESFMDKKIPNDRVKRHFKKWYPDLKEQFDNLPDDERLDDSATNYCDDERLDDKATSYCDEVYSRNLRNFVCFHQGNLIQYFFLAGEYHKELKNEFRKRPKNIHRIEQKLADLKTFIDQSLIDSVGKSFDEIQKMFIGRHPLPPRICLKANFGSADKMIVSIVREKRLGYNSNCHVHENTAFEYIQKNGTNYLNLNIPEAAKKGDYKNPRLIEDEAKKYAVKSSSNQYPDEEWVHCWIGTRGESKTTIRQDFRNCYKSTLVIPLTLWNNKMGAKFIKKFRMKNVDRTIFGYLCFDHIITDYFDPVFDVDSGYVYADVLSLYLLIRFVYIDQSKTFNNISAFLLKKGVIF